MSVEKSVLEKLRVLPPERQREVLDFVEFLRGRDVQSLPRHSYRSLKGLCADLKIHLAAEDIDETRREMWGHFPRENN